MTMEAGTPSVVPDNAPTNAEATVGVQAAEFPQVVTEPRPPAVDRKIDMLLDLNVTLSIELGRRMMPIKDVLELQRGSVVEFDKLAGEPVDILINNKKIAEGEVVVIEKHFGIRITTLVGAAERMKQIGKS